MAAPCAFIEDEQTGILTPRPRYQWFAEGKGVARRKWDGLPALLNLDDDGKKRFYRGVTIPRSEEPEGFRPAEIDDGSGEVFGWIEIEINDELYRQGMYVTFGRGRPFTPGLYWLCGPGINGNPDEFEDITLVPEDFVSYIYTPRKLDDIIYFMAQNPSMGIVWHYDGKRCELTRANIGLAWGAA